MHKKHSAIPFLPLPQLVAKSTRKLLKSTARKESELILVEGEKCCEELLNSKKFKIEYIVCDTDNFSQNAQRLVALASEKQIPIYTISQEKFASLCDAKSPQGIIAIARQITQAAIMQNETFVLLDNVGDPGNVGTIIRTCDWFGIKQVLLAGNCADYRSPKVIRAAMGSTFRINIMAIENEITDIKKYFSKVDIYAAALNGKQTLSEIKPSQPFGLIVGNEARGVSPHFLAIAKCFHIPAKGQAESLNVAIATGIALYNFTTNV